MRPLWELLSDLKRRGVRLRLNQATGRLEYRGELDPGLLDEVRRQRRALEAHLWALQRRPVGRPSSVGPEGAWGIDEPYRW
jgi:hypothetical protein